ncbi:hypothetical protein IF1G_04981 [Cordyceps javanica]|uniref:Uncharacterized protein n=1 Tax=Cordyceps javanica TaxID=43265 RepID=A0A545V3V5_9HYPO|nr:hypothetical protein IF1G_04981 [Cordyceps javanica]
MSCHSPFRLVLSRMSAYSFALGWSGAGHSHMGCVCERERAARTLARYLLQAYYYNHGAAYSEVLLAQTHSSLFSYSPFVALCCWDLSFFSFCFPFFSWLTLAATEFPRQLQRLEARQRHLSSPHTVSANKAPSFIISKDCSGAKSQQSNGCHSCCSTMSKPALGRLALKAIIHRKGGWRGYAGCRSSTVRGHKPTY